MVKVIGIGASADGLEAILSFFRTIKNDKLAYILVQHIAEKTNLDVLLRKAVLQDVAYARDGDNIKPNHIYLHTPGTNLKIENEKIRVQQSKDPSLKNPINSFFKSLAESYQDESIAVILSGTDTDGTLGVLDIKSAGGLVLAQGPTNRDCISNIAISTSAADFINSPENLAKFINTLKLQETKLTRQEEHYLSIILSHVQQASKINFSAYKEPTLMRRIKRRMQLIKTENINTYIEQVKSKEESNNLRKDFLIPVTSFLRDPEVFSYLEHDILPCLLHRAQDANKTLRIWVVGCSIGSEAYSLGILIEEIKKKQQIAVQYKIFASDVDNDAISRASSGIFTLHEINNLPECYRARYFKDIDEKKVQVQQNLREHFLFLNHDLLVDPPLINMDMVSCRNLLIYFKKEFQLNHIKKFHFSLNNEGILLLGKSESVGGLSDKLMEVEKHLKIYKCKKNRVRSVSFLPNHTQPPETSKNAETKLKTTEKKNLIIASQMNKPNNIYDLLLQEIIPNYLIIDEDFEIIYNNVDMKGFFVMTKGSPSLNLLDMVSPDLSLIIRKGVMQVLEQMHPLRLEAVEVENIGDSTQTVDFLLKPISSEKIGKKAILIEIHPLKDATPAVQGIDYSRDSIIQSLKQELEETRHTLSKLEAKLEASNEKLQSTNEELQASNEELQSSNEELQSLNEELYSVNSELQERMKELSQLNEESNQLIEGAELGMVVIDQHSFVLKYTQTAKKLFDLREEAPGKNIFSLEKNFKMDDFPQFINDGFKTSNIYEKEVRTFEGDYFTIRRIPLNNRLILLFLDINRVKDINQLYQIIFENSNDFVSIFDQNNKIKLVNKFASESWHQENVVGSSVLDYIPEEEKRKEVEANIRKMFKYGEPYEYYLKTQDSSGSEFIFLCKTHLIQQTRGALGVLVSRDVTHETQIQNVLDIVAEELADVVLAIDENGCLVAFHAKEPLALQVQMQKNRCPWQDNLTFYRKDGNSILPDDENPLISAVKGIKTEKFELHLSCRETGAKHHLVGDFHPMRDHKPAVNGAIAYLYIA